MKPELTLVLTKLSDKGYNQAQLARYISAKTGKTIAHRSVQSALRRWVGKPDTGYVPRGQTLVILKFTSQILGEPITQSIAYLMNHQAA